ncbi:hypothetical protein [Ectobacillus funiculus]|uniref:hypothetical protein n=1 Tax=Ectobacillus funiculus TaxID=137993 RepID=UPI00101CA452|nr:hypothetical protein [Ectobacillus funiculus]
MERTMHSFYTKLRATVGQTTQTIKEKLEDILKMHTVKVADMAEMIQTHPNSVMSEQTLLYITYRTYRLNVEKNMVLYMETKVTSQAEKKAVNGERILAIEIRSLSQSLFSYRSYENKVDLQEPVKVEHFIENLIHDYKENSPTGEPCPWAKTEA